MQHLFSISRLVILPAGFKKCLANVPVSVDHSGIDRRIDLPLCLDDIALDGPIDVLGLKILQWILIFSNSSIPNTPLANKIIICQ